MLKIKRFYNILDDSVLDAETNLVWQKHTGIYTNFNSALEYCKNLTLNDRTDWRLPSVLELQTLINYDKCLPSILGKNRFITVNNFYWTSTKSAYNSLCTWVINFDFGSAIFIYDTSEAYVRAVRSLTKYDNVKHIKKEKN